MTEWLAWRGLFIMILVMFVTAPFLAEIKPEGDWAVLVISMGAGIASAVIGAKNRKERIERELSEAKEVKASILRSLRADYDGKPFTVDKEDFIRGPSDIAIAVDRDRGLFRIVDKNSEKVLDLGKVRGIEAATTNGPLSLGVNGAIAGGLLFGGAGAVTGAVLGQQSKTISFIGVVIYLDDITTPVVKVNFLAVPVPPFANVIARGSSQMIEGLMDRAVQWKNVLEICTPGVPHSTAHGMVEAPRGQPSL